MSRRGEINGNVDGLGKQMPTIEMYRASFEKLAPEIVEHLLSAITLEISITLSQFLQETLCIVSSIFCNMYGIF